MSDVVPLSTKSSSSSLPVSEAVVIRPELNLEKWPAIWEPAKSRRAFKTRVIEREVTLTDGSRILARVRIAPSTEGTLTTEEQRHLYGLIHLWEEGGRLVDKPTHFSLQKLAKVLKKGWGPRNIETMTQALTRLLATTIFWENAYFDRASGQTEKELHGFHILEELYIAQTSKTGHVTHEACYFRFNAFILNNLLANHTKPVLLNTVLGFQSDIAQIVYTYLDLIMADKTQFRRRTRELFADLGLEGTAYQNVSDRKRTLERALRELQGVPLTTGFVEDVFLERTVDGKDYNLVVRKSRTRPKTAALAGQSSKTPAKEMPTEVSPPSPEGKTDLQENLEFSGALEQVRYFYQTFHGQDQIQASAKEITQAQDHLDRLGVEEARFLVDFVFVEAPKTKFSVQTYGGILRYEARARKAFGSHQEQARQQRQAEREVLHQKARKSHEARFYEAYRAFLRETLTRMENEAPEGFVAFLDQDAQERTKYVRQKLNVYLRTQFDTEQGRLTRFAAFFHNHAMHPVPNFWQWDTAYNPEPFVSDLP